MREQTVLVATPPPHSNRLLYKIFSTSESVDYYRNRIIAWMDRSDPAKCLNNSHFLQLFDIVPEGKKIAIQLSVL